MDWADDCLYLDIQTTGTSPEKDEIIEIGWSRQGEMSTHIIKPSSLPGARVQAITGLGESLLEQGTSLDSIYGAWKRDLSKAACIVIHYARFEKSFLHAWLGDYPGVILCSHQLARQIFPGLKSYSLRSAASEIGNYETADFKRVDAHLKATAAIFQALLKKLRQHDLSSLLDIHKFAKSKKKLSNSEPSVDPASDCPRQERIKRLREQRLAAPKSPGIYFFKNKDKKILYVGKATALRDRLASHFTGKKTKGSKNNELLTRCKTIEWILSETLLEAELMESDLIKQHSPLYNVALQKNARQICYYHPTLTKKMKRPSNISLGPFSSTSNLDKLLSVFHLLQPQKGVKKTEVKPTHSFFQEFLNQFKTEELRQALEEVTASATPKILKSPRSLLCFAVLLYRKKKADKAGTEVVESNPGLEGLEEDENSDTGTTELTPADFLDWILTEAGRNYTQSLSLKKLGNSHVYIPARKVSQHDKVNSEKQWRRLKFSRGNLVQSEWES